jgi:hypothetical protein
MQRGRVAHIHGCQCDRSRRHGEVGVGCVAAPVAIGMRHGEEKETGDADEWDPLGSERKEEVGLRAEMGR